MTVRQTAGLAALALLVALTQGVVVARLPWPGPGAPHLAALVVAAIALRVGVRAGAVVGFGTGLLLDLLPPADHALGQWAFVLCAVGALAGLLARDARASLPVGVVAAAVAAALAAPAFAVFGALLSDPRSDVAGASIHAPLAAGWSLLLAAAVVPFALRPSTTAAVR